MKHFLLLMWSLLIGLSPVLAQQITLLDLDIHILKGEGKGTDAKIVRLDHNQIPNGASENILLDEYYIHLRPSSGKEEYILLSNRIKEAYRFDYKTVQDFWDAAVIRNVLVPLMKSGIQLDLRQEMEDDACEYLQKIRSCDLEFNDPYLESYLYGLILKIAPQRLLDARPYDINLLLVQDPTMNACSFPNGTIVINTGLLAGLHSEDELVAVLAHEIAHYVLDHSIQNINKMIKRQERAEFWAGLLMGATAAAEVAVAANNEYYIPGGATIGMAALSAAIGSQVVERLGMKYNHDQENEADRYAIKILELLDYNTNALSTALNRIREQDHIERNQRGYFASYTHPALNERIFKNGTPQYDLHDLAYERMVSLAVSNSAQQKYNRLHRFRQCMTLLNQNIENGVATADDYLLKAACMLRLEDSPESNSEALALMGKARELDPGNINLHKQEGIVHLRLKHTDAAVASLQAYLGELETVKARLSQNSDKTYLLISQEYKQTQNMLRKLDVLHRTSE